MNNILMAKNIKKVFVNGQNSLSVLKDINLEIREGELVMIVGPSGAGKSTLLSILGGLSRPTTGNVFLEDTDIYKLNDEKLANLRNKKMGFIFQFHHLLPEFTAIENVIMPALIAQENKKVIYEKAKKILISMGLGGRLLHRPSELSGGEQQRVAIARALINEPKIIFADEPTGNLDRANSELINKIILDLNRNFKQTFIIVTHNEQLTSFGTKIIHIEDGIIKNIKNN